MAKSRRLPPVHPGEILREEFWINLQGAYDLDVARRASADQIKRDVHPREAAQATGSGSQQGARSTGITVFSGKGEETSLSRLSGRVHDVEAAARSTGPGSV